MEQKIYNEIFEIGIEGKPCIRKELDSYQLYYLLSKARDRNGLTEKILNAIFYRIITDERVNSQIIKCFLANSRILDRDKLSFIWQMREDYNISEHIRHNKINEEVVLALASNPNTPGEILKRILNCTESESKIILEAIIKNPNTPIEPLINLLIWKIQQNNPESPECELACIHPNRAPKISEAGALKILEIVKNTQNPVLLGVLDKIMQLGSLQPEIPQIEEYFQASSAFVLLYKSRFEVLIKNKLILDFLNKKCQNIHKALGQKDKRKEFLESLKQRPIDELSTVFNVLLQINDENPEVLTLDEINAKIKIGLEGNIPTTSKTAAKRGKFVERILERHRIQEAETVVGRS